jgi:valyl-tRNA synthetase
VFSHATVGTGPQRTPSGVSGEPQVSLPIEGLLGLEGLAGRLANPNFAGKAPPEVVAECQANLAEAQAQAELVRLGELGAAESEP